MIYKILWIHDQFNGPVNGLATDSNDIKLWFRRTSNDTDKLHTYEILQIDPEILEIVENDHAKYCLESGKPLLHGDPVQIKKKEITTKVDFSTIKPENKEGFEIVKKSLVTTNTYNHVYDPNDITGLVIDKISAKEFSNYHVPHRLEKI